jgi:AraC-like DNA-binding protein
MRQVGNGLVRFSAEHLPERDRLAYWRELFGRQVFRLDVEALPDADITCDVALQSFPGLGILSGVVGRGVRSGRTRELLSDGIDDLLLVVNLTGQAVVSQRGRESVLDERDAALVSLGETGGIVRTSEGRSFSLRIPRTAIAPFVANPDDAVLRPIARDSTALRLLTSYVGALHEYDASADGPLRQLIGHHLHDLVAATIGPTRDAMEVVNGRGMRAARLAAIKSDIMENLGRADFSVDDLVRRHGISSRYIRMLFSDEGTTFSEFLLRQRLARAHRALHGARHDAPTIADLAFRCGFGDLSYFYRVFRRAYGATPAEVRAAARRDME